MFRCIVGFLFTYEDKQLEIIDDMSSFFKVSIAFLMIVRIFSNALLREN